MKKSLSMVAALVLALSCFSFIGAGCKRNPLPPGFDASKTQLYIGNYDGGLGAAWLREVADKFEKEHAEECFESGVSVNGKPKKGVQIYIESKKDFTDEMLLTLMPDSANDIFIAGNLMYRNAVNRKVLLDITDIATAKDEDIKEQKVSIDDKMFSDMRKMYYTDSKYYALPLADNVFGIVYDVDLFEDEGLYSNKPGPSGIPNAYDHGLPATWEDFKELMQKMVQKGITPFTWSGQFANYRTRLMNAFWAGYEGPNDFMLNFSFDGDDSQFGKITKSNGYVLQGQHGKKAALIAAHDIISNPAFYSSDAMKTTQSHLYAQEEFVSSILTNKRIAMISEGVWWENEARPVFDLMERYGAKYAYGQRNFAFMPLPKFIGTAGVPNQENYSGNVLPAGSTGVSAACINAKTKFPELSKLFVRFMFLDENMAVFTRASGSPMPYKYEIAEFEYAKMSKFTQSVWNQYSDSNTAVVSMANQTAMVADNLSYFRNWQWGATVSVGAGSSVMTEPMIAFYTYPSLNPDNYFAGLSATFSQTSWNSALSAWF